jgi:hypothetical protein
MISAVSIRMATAHLMPQVTPAFIITPSSHVLPRTGITALANAIPDMGAISSVNLLKNRIGSDQAEALVSILKEHPTLKSLCGNMGNETELDMSGKMDGAGDTVMLVAEIIDNGALTSLNLASNNIGGYYTGKKGFTNYKFNATPEGL